MNYNCLIVDDEAELAQMTCEYFNMFDVKSSYVVNASECREFLRDNIVDIILMDINLGDDSGFALVKEIREKWSMPILFLSARQSDDDVLIALNIGGDDYIKKPCSLSVLHAKVKVALKHLSRETDSFDKISDDIVFFLNKDNLSVTNCGQTIQLKAKEFKLLQVLYDNRNKIVTKEQLFNEVWGNTFFSDGTLNVHIRRLREKLEKNPNEPKLIKTIWGTGYTLEI